MKCGFCGYEFNPQESEQACQSCPIAKTCHLVRCPRCGYEMPPEPALIRWLRSLRSKPDQNTSYPKEQ